MTIKTPIYAWVDFETTDGFLADTTAVLELACRITDGNFNETRHNWGATLDFPVEFNFKDVPMVVREMHDKSGLWSDLIKGATYAGLRSMDTDFHAFLVDSLFAMGLDPMGEAQDKVILAGAGVSHFDCFFLNRDFPISWKRFQGYNEYPDTNRPTMDISTVIRFLRQTNNLPENFDNDSNIFAERLTQHRAMDDMKLAIYQAQILRNDLRLL